MSERTINTITDAELCEQQAYAASVRDALMRPLNYHIVTLGCQMNVRDSETIAGMLDQMGMAPVPTREEADIIIYNTCCVRENAENKALGNVIWLKELKAVKPDQIYRNASQRNIIPAEILQLKAGLFKDLPVFHDCSLFLRR